MFQQDVLLRGSIAQEVECSSYTTPHDRLIFRRLEHLHSERALRSLKRIGGRLRSPYAPLNHSPRARFDGPKSLVHTAVTPSTQPVDPVPGTELQCQCGRVLSVSYPRGMMERLRESGSASGDTTGCHRGRRVLAQTGGQRSSETEQ